MGRKSKLTPDQWAEVDRRLLAGEGLRLLAREFGVDPAALSRRGVAQQSQQVRKAAEQMAAAQSAVAALPVAQQYLAIDLASKLRNISTSLAAGAELQAANFHRLSALAQTELAKVDDADPMSTADSLKSSMVLTKAANESAASPLNLLSANKPTVERINAEKPPEPALDAARLSDGTLQELLDARAP